MRVARMARMIGPDCAVMCNLINTHTHTHTHTHNTHNLINTHTHTYTGRSERGRGRDWSRGRERRRSRGRGWQRGRERSWGRGRSGSGNGGGGERRSAGWERGRERGRDGDGDGDGGGSEDSRGGRNGNEDIIWEGGREAGKRKKPQNSCRRHVGNEGDIIGGKREKCGKRVGPVAANPDNLESNKEAGLGAQSTQGSSKNCTSRESVSPLSRLIRDIRNQCEWPRMTRMTEPGYAVIMCNLISTHTHTPRRLL